MPKQITIYYTNWKGVSRMRYILPIRLFWGSTEFHTEEQWLLEAYDLEDQNAIKAFAMKDVHLWIQ